ncbi:MAG: hypothetical protein M3R24_35780 [Chloroflexota bacterium]|nr:hypothetical protein [Chloroflexota bacterium]
MNDDTSDQAARRLAQIITAVHDAGAHATCIAALDDYINAQLMAAEDMARYQPVTDHLDGCVSCAELYALWYDAHAADPQRPAPPQQGQPDLRFLTGDAQPLLQTLSVVAVQISGGVRFIFSPERTNPRPLPAAVLRYRQHDILNDLSVETPGPHLAKCRIVIEQDAAKPVLCNVHVELTFRDHARTWPFPPVSVVVRYDSHHQRQLTDNLGVVVFTAIPIEKLAVLQIEVDVDSATETS